MSASEINTYEFQSGDVVEMPEKLLEFIAERTTLKKEEMNSKHTDDMLMQDLKAQIEQGTTNRDGSKVPDHRKFDCEGRIDVEQAALKIDY